MDTQRLRHVETLFWEALGLDEQQLNELLSKRCGEDHSLAQLVIALVERDRDLESSHFLEPFPAEDGERLACENSQQNAKLTKNTH